MGRGSERTEADKMRALLRPQAPARGRDGGRAATCRGEGAGAGGGVGRCRASAGQHVPAQGPGGREAAGAARVPLDLAGSWERGLGFVPGVMGSQAGSSAER